MMKSWHPRYQDSQGFLRPSWVITTEDLAFHGSKGDEVVVEQPEPTSEEKRILELLMGRIEKENELRGSQLDTANEYNDILASFLGGDVSAGPLDKSTLAELDRIQSIYQDSRTSAVTEYLDKAATRISQKFAAKGLSDSTIASKADTELSKTGANAFDQIAKEASLFRYGTEQDIRKATLMEKLQKVGLLKDLGSGTTSENVLASLTGQRSQYASMALQAALANAQGSGGWGDLGSLLGMGAGALLAVPTGGMSVLGGATLGGMIGGTSGNLVGNGFR